jgi:hypothetical protein
MLAVGRGTLTNYQMICWAADEQTVDCVAEINQDFIASDLSNQPG